MRDILHMNDTGECSGDHVEDVADMIVTRFGVRGDAVFFDLDGEFVPSGG